MHIDKLKADCGLLFEVQSAQAARFEVSAAVVFSFVVLPFCSMADLESHPDSRSSYHVPEIKNRFREARRDLWTIQCYTVHTMRSQPLAEISGSREILVTNFDPKMFSG